MFSIDQEGEKTIVQNDSPIFSKRILFHHFGIFFDTNVEPIDNSIDLFKTLMQFEIQSDENDHQFILKPLSFNCSLTYDSKNNTILNLNLVLDKLKLLIDHKQYMVLIMLYFIFKIQNAFNFLGRPFKPPICDESSNLWWIYANRCQIFKKTKFQPFNIQRALDFLKNRKNYYQNWENYNSNKNRYSKDYNEYINKLDPNTLVLLKNYTSFVYSKLMSKFSNYISENDNETEEIFPFHFNIKIEKELGVCIKDNFGNPIIDLAISNFSASGNKHQDLNNSSQKINHLIEFSFDSIFLKNCTNEKYPYLIKLDDKINGSIEFDYINPTQISINIPSLSFIFDAKLVSILSHFFDGMCVFFDKSNENKDEKNIESIVKSRRNIKLDLKVGKTSVIIPYLYIIEDQPIFAISFESFEISSELTSKYDKQINESLFNDYFLSIKSIQMFLNDKEITNKINVESQIFSIDNDKISIKISNKTTPIELKLTIFQILLLKELFSYITDLLIDKSNLKQIFLLLNLNQNINIKTDIESISMLLSYKEISTLLSTESFKIILKCPTIIDALVRNDFLNLKISNKAGFEVFDFFTKENGKFLKAKEFDINVTSIGLKTNVNFNCFCIDLYAKAVPLNFLIVLAEFPRDFEWMLHLKKESTISKYLYFSNHQQPHQSKDIQINIKLAEINACLIDSELIKDEKTNDTKIEETEMLKLLTKQILLSINQNEIENTTRIVIDPPQVTTEQFGKIWSTIITNDKNQKSSPIVITLSSSNIISFDVEFFQANILPLLLSKIVKFALIAKKSYSHIHGDPETVKYLKFNINIQKATFKIIHDTESPNYYELDVNGFEFKTIGTTTNHLICMDNLQIIQKLEYKADYKLFEIKNAKFQIGMKLLIRGNIDQNKAKSFNELLNETTIEEWTKRTMNFLKFYENDNLLSQSYFYFYSLDLDFKFNELYCIYSHEFAKNISYLSFGLIDLLKKDSYFNYGSHNIQTEDRLLDISVCLETEKVNFLIVDSYNFNDDPTMNHSYLALANLNLDSVKFNIDPKKWNYNAFINKITLVDINSKNIILEAGQLNVKTIKDDIHVNLESFYLCLKLKYLPDGINYIMGCPLFKFADEFKENKPTPISFKMKVGLFISLKNFNIRIPIIDNSFHFKTSFGIALTPEKNTAKILDIHMLLNDCLIMKKFSINYMNDQWDVDPIFFNYSVFKLHIIHDLLDEYHSLTMPDIYLFEKEAELKKRKFVINFDKINFVLTQPNLPFVILEIKPSTFKQSYLDTDENIKIIEYNAEMQLKHENYSNFGTDTIINPFMIKIKSDSINDQLNAEITPINISLSSSFLSEIFQFKKKYDLYKNSNSSIFDDRIIFFQNDTSICIQLHMIKLNTNEEETIILNDNKPFKINDYDLKKEIKITFQDNTIEFYIHNLCYSFFYQKIAVLYLVVDVGVQTIHFSSPYIVRNQLAYDINVFLDNNCIGQIKKESNMPIPIPFLNPMPNEMKATNYPHSIAEESIQLKGDPKLYKLGNSINSENLYSSVCITNDPQRSLRYITFYPYITYENQLPVKITLSFVNDLNIDHELKSGQKIDVSYLQDNSSKYLKIKISIDVFGNSDELQVLPYSKLSDPIQISIKKDKKIICKIVLICKYDEKTNTYHNIIFAPCVIFNKTGAVLSLKASKNKFYSFLNEMCFYTPDKYFKTREIPLRIIYKDMTLMNDVEIDCMKMNSIEKIALPLIKNKNILFLFSAIKKETYFENIIHIELRVHLTVFNHLKNDVFLIPSNIEINEPCEYLIHCKQMKKSLIPISNLEGKFSLYIDGFNKCQEVNLMNQTTTVFRLINSENNKEFFFIQLDVIKEKEGFCCHLSYPTFPSPIVISNDTSDAIISVDQISESNIKYPLIVNSYTTSLYAKTQPFIEQNSIYENTVILTIIQNNPISFRVCFSTDIPPQKIKDTNYTYNVSTTKSGDKMILLSKILEDKSKDEKNKKMVKIKMPIINVHFAKIEISFIDKLFRELCLSSIKNINYRLEKHKFILFTIQSFRLNDMYIASKSPVVLCEKSAQFLSIEIKSKLPLKMHSYESINIKVSPLQLFIDAVFISDVLYFIYDIINDSKIALIKDEDENGQNLSNNFTRYSFHSIEEIKISSFTIDGSKTNAIRTNRFPLPEKYGIYLLIGKYAYLPVSLHMVFNEYKNKKIRAPLTNFIGSLIDHYINQYNYHGIQLLVKIIMMLIEKPLIKTSSGNFIDLIDKKEDNDFNNDEKKSFVVLPERIPRAFPMNRIKNILIDDYGRNICKFSLAQFAFQKKFHHEKLLLMINSAANQNNENSFLCVFNHFVVHLDENLKNIKNILKISHLLNIDETDNYITLNSKNASIRFPSESNEDSKLVVTLVKSIADRIQLLEI